MTRPATALLIPCPWSGDENAPVPYSYRVWIWLYKHTRIARHRLGLHADEYVYALRAHRCTWCGRTDR